MSLRRVGGLDLMSYFQMFIESYFSCFLSGKDEMFEPFVSFKCTAWNTKLLNCCITEMYSQKSGAYLKAGIEKDRQTHILKGMLNTSPVCLVSGYISSSGFKIRLAENCFSKL